MNKYTAESSFSSEIRIFLSDEEESSFLENVISSAIYKEIAEEMNQFLIKFSSLRPEERNKNSKQKIIDN